MSNKNGSNNFIATAEITLTPEEILTLNSAPVELIAGPGAGKIIDVISITARLNYNSVPFDFNTGTLIFFSSNDTSSNGYWNLHNFAGGESSDIHKADVFSSNSVVVEGAGLSVTAAEDATVGDSTMDIYISYRVMDL